jgi:hypothetical protein
MASSSAGWCGVCNRKVTQRNNIRPGAHFFCRLGEEAWHAIWRTVDGIDVMESTNVTVTHAIGIGLDDLFSTKTWADTTDLYNTVPGTARPLSNVTFDDLVSWTYCYGVKVDQGVVQSQDGVTFQYVVVYDAAAGIGVHHKYGAASATDIKFDDIDIERLSYSNDSNRTWLAMMTGRTQGIGPVTGVTISNVKSAMPAPPPHASTACPAPPSAGSRRATS